MRDGLPVWCWWVIGCVLAAVTAAGAYPDVRMLWRWWRRRRRAVAIARSVACPPGQCAACDAWRDGGESGD